MDSEKKETDRVALAAWMADNKKLIAELQSRDASAREFEQAGNVHGALLQYSLLSNSLHFIMESLPPNVVSASHKLLSLVPRTFQQSQTTYLAKIEQLQNEVRRQCSKPPVGYVSKIVLPMDTAEDARFVSVKDLEKQTVWSDSTKLNVAATAYRDDFKLRPQIIAIDGVRGSGRRRIVDQLICKLVQVTNTQWARHHLATLDDKESVQDYLMTTMSSDDDAKGMNHLFVFADDRNPQPEMCRIQYLVRYLRHTYTITTNYCFVFLLNGAQPFDRTIFDHVLVVAMGAADYGKMLSGRVEGDEKNKTQLFDKMAEHKLIRRQVHQMYHSAQCLATFRYSNAHDEHSLLCKMEERHVPLITLSHDRLLNVLRTRTPLFVSGAGQTTTRLTVNIYNIAQREQKRIFSFVEPCLPMLHRKDQLVGIKIFVREDGPNGLSSVLSPSTSTTQSQSDMVQVLMYLPVVGGAGGIFICGATRIFERCTPLELLDRAEAVFRDNYYWTVSHDGSMQTQGQIKKLQLVHVISNDRPFPTPLPTSAPTMGVNIQESQIPFSVAPGSIPLSLPTATKIQIQVPVNVVDVKEAMNDYGYKM